MDLFHSAPLCKNVYVLIRELEIKDSSLPPPPSLKLSEEHAAVLPRRNAFLITVTSNEPRELTKNRVAIARLLFF